LRHHVREAQRAVLEFAHQFISLAAIRLARLQVEQVIERAVGVVTVIGGGAVMR
jgi:uridylate kinase